jgi:hypothetical protein
MDNFKALGASMSGPQATGTRMSLGELMGFDPSASKSASSSSATQVPTTAESGFGFGFAMPAVVAAAAQPANDDAAATPRKSKPPAKRGAEEMAINATKSDSHPSLTQQGLSCRCRGCLEL